MRLLAAALAALSLVAIAGCHATEPASAQQAPPPPAAGSSQEAATAGLDTLRRLAGAGNFREMGFEAPEQAQAATLGEPLHVYLVRLDQLRAYQPGTDPESLLNDVGQDLYPVRVANGTRSSILVAKTAAGWRAVGFGGAKLAKAADQRRMEKMAEAKAPPTAYAEIHVAALNLYFLSYREGTQLMLVPLVDDPDKRFHVGIPIPAGDAFALLARQAKSIDPDVPR
jgi:hypothetical protein